MLGLGIRIQILFKRFKKSEGVRLQRLSLSRSQVRPLDLLTLLSQSTWPPESFDFRYGGRIYPLKGGMTLVDNSTLLPSGHPDL